MKTTLDIAAKVWNLVYPDRRPFDQIEATAQQEWGTVTSAAITIYLTNFPQGEGESSIEELAWAQRLSCRLNAAHAVEVAALKARIAELETELRT